MAEGENSESRKNTVRRRDFLRGGGIALAAGTLGVGVSGVPAPASPQGERAQSYPESTGYIVYDSKLCWGCQSCMFVCSAAHYGVANPALSRIQIVRDAPSFTKYPLDIVMSVCRQCVTPLCVENCPTGAAHVDAENGNVRVIDPKQCIGCRRCIQSCPQRPHRPVWNPDTRKSTKCDLCIDAPYWSRKGGPGGEPACVTSCPSKALKLVSKAPSQEDIAGYDVDLTPAEPASKP